MFPNVQVWKEGTVSFNDALNTFYLQLYGFGHVVKDHSDSERGNPLPPHELLFLISSKGSFICTISHRFSTYHGLCGAVVEHWLEREIAQWVHHEGSIRRQISHRLAHTTAFVTAVVEHWLEREIAQWARSLYHGATSRSAGVSL